MTKTKLRGRIANLRGALQRSRDLEERRSLHMWGSGGTGIVMFSATDVHVCLFG